MGELRDFKSPGGNVDIVKLNVGGITYMTSRATLLSVPDTRLSGLTHNSKEYVPDFDMYFFDRNPDMFNFVLEFYRTGQLHLPKHVCGATIRNELEYWQVRVRMHGSAPSLVKYNVFNSVQIRYVHCYYGNYSFNAG